MHFDDRLATVLRLRAIGERAAKTQYRQLLDLLGERPQAGDPALKAAAYLRLIALGELIPTAERAAIVGEYGWRFRNPELVKWFGEAHPHVAAAALYRARLSGEEWAEIIPRLPIRARGFLRHRRDLPQQAVDVLDRLGVSDRALPQPEPLELIDELVPPEEEENPPYAQAGEEAAQPENEPAAVDPQTSDLRSLVDRIDTLRRAKTSDDSTPEVARDETVSTATSDVGGSSRLDQFHFGTDFEGRIDWSQKATAPMVVGIDLTALGSETVASAIARRQPVRNASVGLRGARAIEGEWTVDATPRFTQNEGRFIGYVGRFRRVVDVAGDAADAQADRLRQLLHELRTPVTAMQGYAEIIQQQMIGPVPHEYRSIAATIAGDAAHILAGFDELDRLAKLEVGALTPEPGEADFAAILRHQIQQLQGVLSPRVARFDADLPETTIPVALDPAEAEALAWRLLATLAGAANAGENIGVTVERNASRVVLKAHLPLQLSSAEDIFSVETRPTAGSVSAGIFGAGFSLRLARAEARAIGGDLVREGDNVILSLPIRVPARAAG